MKFASKYLTCLALRGLQNEKGKYLVLSDAEIRAANLKPTQTVGIVAFVDASELDPAYFEMPYFLSAQMRGQKVYALLRETLIAGPDTSPLGGRQA